MEVTSLTAKWSKQAFLLKISIIRGLIILKGIREINPKRK
jgi:hypothetical protein